MKGSQAKQPKKANASIVPPTAVTKTPDKVVTGASVDATVTTTTASVPDSDNYASDTSSECTHDSASVTASNGFGLSSPVIISLPQNGSQKAPPVVIPANLTTTVADSLNNAVDTSNFDIGFTNQAISYSFIEDTIYSNAVNSRANSGVFVTRLTVCVLLFTYLYYISTV